MKALIVFVKYPRTGSVKTRLAASIGVEQAAKIYEEWACHTFSIADELAGEGITPWIFYHEGAPEPEVRAWVRRPFRFCEQGSGDLGVRMKRAFERVFREKAEAAVIVGTDVPELDAATVREAFRLLEGHDVAVGPSPDGGYYVLGMKAVQGALFSEIEWSSSKVYNQTIHRAAGSGLSCAVLPALADIDTGADYHAYLVRTGRSKKQSDAETQ